MKPTFIPFLYVVALLIPASLAAQTLSLKQAERLALENDPLALSYQANAQAFDEQSIAANSWPDPRLKFGFLSLPTDSFELDQEPMTQIVLGYQQMLPRGDSEQLNSTAMQAMALSKRNMATLRQREVLKKVRLAWLNVFLQQQASIIVEKNRSLFRQQLDVSQSLYAAGKGQQQDVLQAELDLSLLDDRLENIATKEQEARAQLAQWIGFEAAAWSLALQDGLMPSINSDDLSLLKQLVEQHPKLKTQQALIENAQAQVDLANEKYSPQWSFDVTYGKRDGQNLNGSDRADFLTALVNIDLPVFTENRQDRQLAASKKQLQARRYEKQDVIQTLQSQLEQMYVRWQQLEKRIHHYDYDVLTRARQNAKAAFNGYQSGVVSFLTLTRARSVELKAELQRLELNVKKAQTLAEIYYLVGEAS